MRSLLKVGLVLLAAGLGLLATAILLTREPKLTNPYPSGPNSPALLALLLGSLLLWLGCVGIAVVLPRRWVVLAGFLTVAGSFVLPWSLHAIGVTWWSNHLIAANLALPVAGCIQLGVAVIRLAIFAASPVVSAATQGPRRRALRRYLGSTLIGLALGFPLYFCLVRWYAPPPVLSVSFPARFDWDSAHGVKTFRLEDNALGHRVGGRAWRYLVALQIKPALDSYLRSAQFQRATGWAGVTVARVIPIALPGGWGSDDMELDTDVTTLMRAAQKGDLESVRRLLAGRADVNARDWVGKTPLLHACGYGHISPQVVAALLAAGADPNASDKGGVTALMGAAGWWGGKDKTLVILRALLAAGANTNAKDINGRTALMSAAAEGDLEAVRLLLEAGADVAAHTNDGSTALSLARQYKHPDVVQVLAEAGARE
jgi:hypothetical protein